jgi:hypothetical protein
MLHVSNLSKTAFKVYKDVCTLINKGVGREDLA